MFDKAFPSLQANLHLNYAYHIPLNYDNVNLSFGLGTKIMYHNLDFNKGDLPPGDDNAFSASSYDKTLGDASSGTYLYGRDFYFGFAISNLFQSSFNTPIEGSVNGNDRLSQENTRSKSCLCIKTVLGGSRCHKERECY